MANSWRENLKSGPLQRLYLLARNTKRRLRGEPLAGTAPVAHTPLSVGELRALAGSMPSHARLYYSLGLGYADEVTYAADQRALACFRCADSLRFEAPERTALYKALVMARRGKTEQARLLIGALDPQELTAAESCILSDLLQNRVVPHQEKAFLAGSPWENVGRELERSCEAAESMLVIGDPQADSADWLPRARYMLIEPTITGLTVQCAGAVGWRFDVGVASVEWQREARSAGIICSNWLSPD